jgi:hypothetical protein
VRRLDVCRPREASWQERGDHLSLQELHQDNLALPRWFRGDGRLAFVHCCNKGSINPVKARVRLDPPGLACALEVSVSVLPCEPTFGHAKGHDDAFRAPVARNRAAELDGHGAVEKLAPISAFACR